jgi:sulfite dehydrogenase (cytochrome) subunit B
MKRQAASILTALVIAAAALGDKKSITLPGDNAMAELRPGPGAEVVRANCVACHSTDYIVRQPGSDAKKWEAEVKKMIAVFGAPISEGDAKVIVDYLSSGYGPQGSRAERETRLQDQARRRR